MDIFTELIQEICAEEQIECVLLSHDWIMQLTRNGRVRHIVGRHFDLNGSAADLIACDKYACCTVLQHGGVPVIEHTMLFNPLTRTNWIEGTGEWERAIRFFEANGRRVVVKPNNGWQGRDVYFCDTLKALERAAHTIFQYEPNVCLCPFYDFENEYRMFYVNGACRYAYGKNRAQVTGDGIRDLRTLAAEAEIPDDSLFFSKEPDYVPNKGETVRVSWKHNLTNGAAAFEILDQALLSRLYALAERAAQCININFATVDAAAMPDGTLRIMEINAGVTVKKLLEQHPARRETAKQIYAEAVRAMFA